MSLYVSMRRPICVDPCEEAWGLERAVSCFYTKEKAVDAHQNVIHQERGKQRHMPFILFYFFFGICHLNRSFGIEPSSWTSTCISLSGFDFSKAERMDHKKLSICLYLGSFVFMVTVGFPQKGFGRIFLLYFQWILQLLKKTIDWFIF